MHVSGPACYHIFQALHGHVLFLSERGFLQQDSLNIILTELFKLDPQSSSPSSPSKPRAPHGINPFVAGSMFSMSVSSSQNPAALLHERSNGRLLEENGSFQRLNTYQGSTLSTNTGPTVPEPLDMGSNRGSSVNPETTHTRYTTVSPFVTMVSASTSRPADPAVERQQIQQQDPESPPTYVEPLAY